MENDRSQKELFEFEAPKKVLRPRFSQFFQKTDFGVTLTVEKLVFVSIGIIMLMVVFFAIGVEKGKSLPARNAMPLVPAQTVTIQVPTKAVAALVPRARDVTIVKNIAPQNRNAVSLLQKNTSTAPANTAVEARNTQVPQPIDRPYTIVAAAFLRQDLASKKAAILKRNSLDAFVYYSEPYYLACVGSFSNKNSAQKVLSKVRQLHHDAYVMLR
ncbi:MAG: hypothetical protein A3I73_05245 [Omnitrophica bacterium RIFCSPLOWO2_02_FULL_45_16]|nr:MAG: hypothetical protein A3C51_00575 [Omnitrophica bacterium RIFCSPHIGHO2_02_FULL_46_20]OGW93729.1 MAG: hypothetical protein A3K16_01895 [Omnitrophica bacterium RIFCSPLOWO2_01_FULL_45_24]OGX00865.1 MAG: hypothetical protein A3I73_05245 [Omnitrophica bacterium RIFCSPLOWO2_02_FULL_45_16]